MRKAQHDFGSAFPGPEEFRNTTLSPYQRYLQYYIQNRGVEVGLENYINWKEFVKRAIRQNRNDLVQYAINHGFQNWDPVLREYAAKGNREMVNFFLKLNDRPQKVAEGALKGHQIELFNDLVKILPEDIT